MQRVASAEARSLSHISEGLAALQAYRQLARLTETEEAPLETSAGADLATTPLAQYSFSTPASVHQCVDLITQRAHQLIKEQPAARRGLDDILLYILQAAAHLNGIRSRIKPPVTACGNGGDLGSAVSDLIRQRKSYTKGYSIMEPDSLLEAPDIAQNAPPELTAPAAEVADASSRLMTIHPQSPDGHLDLVVGVVKACMCPEALEALAAPALLHLTYQRIDTWPPSVATRVAAAMAAVPGVDAAASGGTLGPSSKAIARLLRRYFTRHAPKVPFGRFLPDWISSMRALGVPSADVWQAMAPPMSAPVRVVTSKMASSPLREVDGRVAMDLLRQATTVGSRSGGGPNPTVSPVPSVARSLLGRLAELPPGEISCVDLLDALDMSRALPPPFDADGAARLLHVAERAVREGSGGPLQHPSQLMDRVMPWLQIGRVADGSLDSAAGISGSGIPQAGQINSLIAIRALRVLTAIADHVSQSLVSSSLPSSPSSTPKGSTPDRLTTAERLRLLGSVAMIDPLNPIASLSLLGPPPFPQSGDPGAPDIFKDSLEQFSQTRQVFLVSMASDLHHHHTFGSPASQIGQLLDASIALSGSPMPSRRAQAALATAIVDNIHAASASATQRGGGSDSGSSGQSASALSGLLEDALTGEGGTLRYPQVDRGSLARALARMAALLKCWEVIPRGSTGRVDSILMQLERDTVFVGTLNRMIAEMRGWHDIKEGAAMAELASRMLQARRTRKLRDRSGVFLFELVGDLGPQVAKAAEVLLLRQQAASQKTVFDDGPGESNASLSVMSDTEIGGGVEKLIALECILRLPSVVVDRMKMKKEHASNQNKLAAASLKFVEAWLSSSNANSSSPSNVSVASLPEAMALLGTLRKGCPEADLRRPQQHLLSALKRDGPTLTPREALRVLLHLPRALGCSWSSDVDQRYHPYLDQEQERAPSGRELPKHRPQLNIARTSVAAGVSRLLASRITPVAHLLPRDDLLAAASSLVGCAACHSPPMGRLMTRDPPLLMQRIPKPTLQFSVVRLSSSGDVISVDNTSGDHEDWPAMDVGEAAVRGILRELQHRLPVLSISQLQQVAWCGEALERPPSACLAAAGAELASRLSLKMERPEEKKLTSSHIWSMNLMLQTLGRQGLVDHGLIECASRFISTIKSKEAEDLRRTLDSINKRKEVLS